MGAAVVGGDDLVGLDVDQAGLGGGGAAVHAQDVLASCAHRPGLLLEVCDLGERAVQVLEAVEAYQVGAQQLLAAGEGRARLPRQNGRAEGLEVGGFLGYHEVDLRRQVLDEAQYVGVEGGAAREHDTAVHHLGPLEEVHHLGGHDHRQGDDDVVLGGLALVEAVGAVGLHEDGAAGGERHHLRVVAHPGGVLQVHVHSRELLLEELAGARGALVAGEIVDDGAALVEGVDDEVLASHGDDGVHLLVNGAQGGLDAERLDGVVEGEEAPALVSGDQGRGADGRRVLGKGLVDGREEVALVGKDGAPGDGITIEQHHLQAGGTNVYPETFHHHLVCGGILALIYILIQGWEEKSLIHGEKVFDGDCHRPRNSLLSSYFRDRDISSEIDFNAFLNTFNPPELT